MDDTELDDYERRKDEVRWEIAWELFDAVNQGQGMNTKFEVDLNELDVEEA